MEKFEDNDAGYLDWLASHPDGFVLNTDRNPRLTPYVKLHRADCGTIRGAPARGSQWTHAYIKVCGQRHELQAYARDTVGSETVACGLCL